MTGKIIILMTVIMAGGAPQDIRSSQTFDTMTACEAAKTRVASSYERSHPNARVTKVACTQP
jgi:hypothetical protein